MRNAAVLISALLCGACGGSDDSGGDGGLDGRSTDATVAVDQGNDQLLPDGPPPVSNFGAGCQSNRDCEPGSPLCVLFDTARSRGLCSAACSPDDPGTTFVNEDSCPLSEGFSCSPFVISSGVFLYCMQPCTPSLTENPCPPDNGTTCHPLSSRFSSSLEQAICFFAACEDGRDCPVFSDRSCRDDDDCQTIPDAGPAPDGGLDATAGDGAVADGASDGTVDGGSVSMYCVQGVGLCALPGNCTPGGLCGPHAHGNEAAKVGDPCQSDLDCPGAGSCLVEEDAGFGVEFRNGYCVVQGCSFAQAVPEYGCPDGSTCHNLYYGGLCHKTCELDDPDSCRGVAGDRGGDYECYAWDQLTLGDIPVTDSPVCQSAVIQTCDSLGTELNCTALAASEDNPTQMSCRDPLTGAPKSDPFDPSGVCLDNTASGTFNAGADAGVDGAVDAGIDGAVDAGVDGAADAGVDGAVDATVDGSG